MANGDEGLVYEEGHDYEEEECADLEPFFYDEAEAVADHEMRMRRELITVEVAYAVVKDAVEATIEIEVLQGEFYGTITACTTAVM
ncbi:hypothetical protein PR202_ga19260 [Eleusine coracana subsp. coracana]|uniref:DUF6598 domain-containing protein n=1 Tax=Eleusine coracana subsp. coracana TaxID=191504 RepID=A0AAV5CUL4_ELECO|nr:hypothetical protein PR202_ga19260 [Eleusine coracana subsp. coracana]